VNERKSLVVVYRYRGGIHVAVAGETESVTIPAPPGPKPPVSAPITTPESQGLVVLYGRYGYDGTYSDVTKKIQALVKGNKLVVRPNQAGLGDPDPDHLKALIVVYREGGGRIRLATMSEAATTTLVGEAKSP
jgi:hypothetical protein